MHYYFLTTPPSYIPTNELKAAIQPYVDSSGSVFGFIMAVVAMSFVLKSALK